MKTELLASGEIEKASLILKAGGLVALPTETVYGLAGNALSSETLLKIFQAKDRPHFDPLIVHLPETVLDSPEGAVSFLVRTGILSHELEQDGWKELLNPLFRRFWPGPLTLVLPKGPVIPDEATSGNSRVGIRVPKHPVFQAVLKHSGLPLAAPSANRFGRISPTRAVHALSELDGRIEAVLDGGPCEVGLESTIVGLTLVNGGFEGSLLRPGKISKAELEAELGLFLSVSTGLGEANRILLAPGMLDQHYAPTKPLLLVPGTFGDLESIRSLIQDKGLTGRGAFLCLYPSGAARFPSRERIEILAPDSKLETAAKSLFATLRLLDEAEEIDFIVAECPENRDQGIAAALSDRLNRASVNKPLLGR
jgi:L-threonylcarbamoyladenylate synthase